MANEGYEVIGNKRIAILVPSRYGELSPIDADRRDQAKLDVRTILSELCGGATQEEVLLGAFRQGSEYVDEPVTRIYSVAPGTVLNDPSCRNRLIGFARELCNRLSQECIGLEWADELIFAYATGPTNARPLPFKRLPEKSQDVFAIIALRRLRNLDSIGQLLSLDCWKTCKSTRHVQGELSIECIRAKGNRKAWISRSPIENRHRYSVSGVLNSNDLLFDQKDNGSIRVWMCIGTELRGGRPLPLAGEDGRIPRSALNLTLSLLDASTSTALREVIDRSAVTAYFFQEYRRLRDNVMSCLADAGYPETERHREAQRLLGRLMFLRFMEQKGELNDAHFLRIRFCKNYYRTVLDPLFFNVLNIPPQDREKASQLPFLNGGLFQAPVHRDISLPDSLFDPKVQGSILDVFYRFEFTLDEQSHAREEVSVDPSMFGLVLESLADPDQRKKTGIHYTPAAIAKTLARESIWRRLAQIADIDFVRFREYCLGKADGITETEADVILKSLGQLRILDPAVGSGSLLLAALEAMLELFHQCNAQNGITVQRGGRFWSEEARRYVRDCLYGVDIDGDAVEIAKLRLWLALAIEDESGNLRPLPDLTHNIRVGDSLSEIRSVELGTLELPFSLHEEVKNRFRDALKEYHQAEGLKIRLATETLNSAERAYLIAELSVEESAEAKQRIAMLKSGAPLPFFWHIHFQDVFSGPNKGFDVVIANPPYVRIQNTPTEQLRDHKTRFQSMSLRNADLYLAFVEQALHLAGKNGQIAFIMPSFARSQAGAPLRSVLGKRGSVELWVDFGDLQVFPTASNYVSLLFATAAKRSRKSFECRIIQNKGDLEKAQFIDNACAGVIPYKDRWGHLQPTPRSPLKTIAAPKVCAPGIWRVSSKQEQQSLFKLERKAVPLGELAEVQIGIQTSKDDIFLLTEIGRPEEKNVTVRSDYLNREVQIERSAALRCAKGSVHLKPFRLAGDVVWCLWPYNENGQLLEASYLREFCPKAWKYLKECEPALRAREGGKFERDIWWRFRRPQGVKVSRIAGKILVPSTMGEPSAFLDDTGQVAFTASGTGGGGAWGITLKQNEARVSILWVLAVLNSPSLWTWLRREGDPKRGGWRGVDQALLRRVPIPVPPKTTQKKAEMLCNEIHKIYMSKDLVMTERMDAARGELSKLVEKAYAG